MGLLRLFNNLKKKWTWTRTQEQMSTREPDSGNQMDNDAQEFAEDACCLEMCFGIKLCWADVMNSQTNLMDSLFVGIYLFICNGKIGSYSANETTTVFILACDDCFLFLFCHMVLGYLNCEAFYWVVLDPKLENGFEGPLFRVLWLYLSFVT